MSQATQEHEVLASAETVDELAVQMHKLITKYRLYSRGEMGKPDSLVGMYDTEAEAREKMNAISYDCDPKEFFYIDQGDDRVWPEEREPMWA